jgi:hypothetical protein
LQFFGCRGKPRDKSTNKEGADPQALKSDTRVLVNCTVIKTPIGTIENSYIGTYQKSGLENCSDIRILVALNPDLKLTSEEI